MINRKLDVNFSSEDFTKFAREMLSLLDSDERPMHNSVDIILRKLSDDIFKLREKNISFEAIAVTLQSCGIKVNTSAVQDFYYQTLASRVKTCEHEIWSHWKPKWNDLVEQGGIIESGLRESLRSGDGLVLHYQPQVNMSSGAILGAEALVRWRFNGSLMSPADFVPVAERSGLIIEIGDWVLREACKEAKRWQKLGLGSGMGIKMGVNLSVKQFSQGLPSAIHDILLDTDLPAQSSWFRNHRKFPSRHRVIRNVEIFARKRHSFVN
jgi:hypothetical protein